MLQREDLGSMLPPPLLPAHVLADVHQHACCGAALCRLGMWASAQWAELPAAVVYERALGSALLPTCTRVLICAIHRLGTLLVAMPRASASIFSLMFSAPSRPSKSSSMLRFISTSRPFMRDACSHMAHSHMGV